MHLHFKGVNDAFSSMVNMFHRGEIPTYTTASRNGEVQTCTEPMMVTYEKPWERVLFNPGRDANPFFHLYEALWMLAGRNDLAPLKFYVSNFDNYSDDKRTLNGAYGYRWKSAPVSYFNPEDWYNQYGERHGYAESGVVNQLEILIEHLRRDPFSRRAVLQMWNVEDDLLKIGSWSPCKADGCRKGKWENGRGRAMLEDGADCPTCKGKGEILSASRDVCCNLSVVFKVRMGDCRTCNRTGMLKEILEDKDILCPKCNGMPHEVPRYLDMTVYNRSNDFVWGMLGANFVHFSFLQQYMANALGLEMGRYTQVSCDLHFYTERWEPEKYLENTASYYEEIKSAEEGMSLFGNLPSFADETKTQREIFDEEVRRLVEDFSQERTIEQLRGYSYNNWWLDQVARPMLTGYQFFRVHKLSVPTFHYLNTMCEPFWHKAACDWINRRIQRNLIREREKEAL